MSIPIGQRLKRKFADFQEVEVVGHLNDYIIIKDSYGRHFIRTNKVNDFFEFLEPDEVDEITNVYNHQNLDNPQRHNVGGTTNRPSVMQELAFKEEQEEK